MPRFPHSSSHCSADLHPTATHRRAFPALLGPHRPISNTRKESVMDLLPHDVRAALARFPLGSQDGRGMDALVVVKYFFPAGRYTLYVTEAEFDGDDAQFFGYCLSPFGEDCDEWGYASLAEFRSLRV